MPILPKKKKVMPKLQSDTCYASGSNLFVVLLLFRLINKWPLKKKKRLINKWLRV